MDDFDDMPARRGRSARTNPPNRFEPTRVVNDPAALDEDELRQVETEFFEENPRSILSENRSPDIPFTYSINPYRGCEHGCVYCYARPTHEYWGWSAGLDFETKIVVKKNAPQMLSEAFQEASWQPQVVTMSGNTDPYQPVERRLEITRDCLRVFLQHRNPVGVITKNGLVRRDIDLLAELAERDLVHVMMSVTSLKPEITEAMEPRTARPSLRLKAIRELAGAGVPVGVNAAPIVPGLTDEEVPAILEAAAEAGATTAGYTMMRLPGAVEELFVEWLERTFPARKNRVLNAVRSVRDGELNDRHFGTRMSGTGERALLIGKLFETTCKKQGLNATYPALTTEHFRRLPGGQRSLFG